MEEFPPDPDSGFWLSKTVFMPWREPDRKVGYYGGDNDKAPDNTEA